MATLSILTIQNSPFQHFCLFGRNPVDDRDGLAVT